jgi:hypothetical protein
MIMDTGWTFRAALTWVSTSRKRHLFNVAAAYVLVCTLRQLRNANIRHGQHKNILDSLNFFSCKCVQLVVLGQFPIDSL